MKFIFAFILLFALPFVQKKSNSVFAQNISLSQPEIDRMIIVYTYYVVQNVSLEILSVKYPELSRHAKDAIKEWDRQFLVSIQNIDKILADTLKDKWNTNKQNIIDKYGGTDYSSVTKDESKKYIEMIFQRALGKMESPILETLLIFKPGFLNNPEKEFGEGFVGTYSTKDLKKSIGINLKLVYPRTWLVVNGNSKTTFLQKYISNYGLGKASFFITIINSKKELSDAVIKQLVSEDNLRKSLTKTDSFISYSNTPAIDNLPTGVISFRKTETSLDKTVYIQSENYHAYYKSFHIIVSFNYTTNNQPQELSLLSKRYYKLARRIVSNIAVISQWEHKRF